MEINNGIIAIEFFINSHAFRRFIIYTNEEIV